MFVPKNHEVTMRCPVCFGRDIDVLMRRDEHGRYSCLKCSYQGDEAEIRSLYADLQKKFKRIATRIGIDDYDRL